MLDERIGMLLANTAWLVAGTLAISMPVGTFLAALLVRTDLPLRRVWLAILAAMLFVPLYLQAAAWQAGFGLQGWYTMIFAQPGTPPLLTGWRGAIWVHALAAIPWVALIVSAGLRLVEPELEEDALLHTSARRVFLHVTLRRAAPLIAVAALWTGVTTAGEMTVTDLFQVRTYAEELYTNFALGDPEAVRLGTAPIVLATTLAVLLGAAVVIRYTSNRSLIRTRPPLEFRLRAWRYPLSALCIATMFMLVGVPLANLLYMGGIVVDRSGDDFERSWSVLKLSRLLLDQTRYSPVFHWSIVISSLAATAVVIFAVPLAWFARRRLLSGLFVFVAITAALATPPPVLALSITEALTSSDDQALEFLRNRTIFAPWLGQTVRALPLGLLAVWGALRSVPEETLEMARLDGAGPLRRLFLVALPQRWPAVVLAWLIAFAIALGDLAATVILVPPGIQTLSIRIFELIHYGVNDALASLCLVLFAVVALIGIFAIQLSRRLLRQ